MSPLVDHNHTHQWVQIGICRATSSEITVVYECSECDAWTMLEKGHGSRVPFREGELSDPHPHAGGGSGG